MAMHSYFVVMIDYARGREAVVDPEITRRDVIERIASGEYKNIAFIHAITTGQVPEDVTEELLAEAGDVRDARAEAAWERHCEAFHDGGATQFKSLQQQQIEAMRLK